MQKLNFKFNAFNMTYQPNNTNNLILIVADDVAASIIYPTLAISTNISLSCTMKNGYFDLCINLNDSKQFFELNLPLNDETKSLSACIDRSVVTELWIGFLVDKKLIPYGTALALSH